MLPSTVGRFYLFLLSVDINTNRLLRRDMINVSIMSFELRNAVKSLGTTRNVPP